MIIGFRLLAGSAVVLAGLGLADAGMPRVPVAATPATQAGRRPPSGHLNFVGCPMIRDTSTVPCWLAEYEGELYYLGSQGSTSSAFYPPWLKHEALVEAEVGEGPRICGGLPLERVEVSVMPELNLACDTILPAEPGMTAPPPPRAVVPAFSDATREFFIPYDFESDYLTLHTTRIVQEAVRIAGLMDAPRVTVHAARGAVLLSNGEVLFEGATLARQRAEKMRTLVAGLGIDAARIEASWDSDAAEPDGVSDRDRRRLVIRLSDRTGH